MRWIVDPRSVVSLTLPVAAGSTVTLVSVSMSADSSLSDVGELAPDVATLSRLCGVILADSASPELDISLQVWMPLSLLSEFSSPDSDNGFDSVSPDAVDRRLAGNSKLWCDDEPRDFCLLLKVIF